MIIGTAGHIDHGKSALVRALTGQEMDRLQEERRRGITIDLNFAPLAFEGLPPVGIVDVPGHEDFVRTMVAGASGIDLVLLVVDAVEGPMPQTREHLAVVEQLGVAAGIPVLTKCDLAEAEWLDLMEVELAEWLSGSAVRFGPVARVSALTGEGVPALRARLRDAAEHARPRRGADVFRMPVDRAFSLPGVGTVLTGTTWAGALTVGDEVRLLPAGHRGRVRSLASHHVEVTRVTGGMRAAIGLAGLERSAVRRGEMLVREGDDWAVTSALDATVTLLQDAPRPLAPRTRVRVHLGTTEVLARVVPRERVSPGGEGLVRLALEAPTVARAGDRLVLRSYSPVTTIGGGVVRDPAPPRRAAWPTELEAPGDGERLLALLARRKEGIPAAQLHQFTGLPPADATRLAERTTGVRRVQEHWVLSNRVREAEAAAVGHLREWHAARPAEAGLSLGTLRESVAGPSFIVEEALRSLQRRGELMVEGGLARLPGFEASLQGGATLVERVAEVLEEAGLQPPAVGELADAIGSPEVEPALRMLAAAGRAERVAPGWYWATSALEAFAAAVRDTASPDGVVTPAALRDSLGLSRKYLIPLLEWADRKGLTRRDGDRRVLIPVK